MDEQREEHFNGFRQAERLFRDAGLSMPPVPPALAHNIRMIQPWCFATRDINPQTMYMFDHYVQQALTGSAPDYLAFAHGGHGANSYALTYHLVDGALAVFAQVLWGGVYTDTEQARAEIQQLFSEVGSLISAAESARDQQALPPRGRLIVCESPMRDVLAWGWLDDPLANPAAAASWMQEKSSRAGAEGLFEKAAPVREATAWLRQRASAHTSE